MSAEDRNGLPEGWTKERDPAGRIFYSNHQTRSTTWNHPGATAPAPTSYEPPAVPGPYHGHPPSQSHGQHHQQYAYPPLHETRPLPAPAQWTCGRLSFWISAGLGWVVWALVLNATLNNGWFDGDSEFTAGNRDILEFCAEDYADEEFCTRYIAFTVVQYVAILFGSLAVLVGLIASCRPSFRRVRCCATWGLGITTGILLIVCVLFELTSIVLVVVMRQDAFGPEPQFGATFYLSAFACLLGIIVAIFLLCFAGEAGSGPINQCCCDTANNNAMDTARASTVVRGGGVADFGSLKSQGRSDDFRSNHHNEHVASNLSSVGRDPITAFPAERWASTSEAASNTAAEQKM